MKNKYTVKISTNNDDVLSNDEHNGSFGLETEFNSKEINLKIYDLVKNELKKNNKLEKKVNKIKPKSN